MRWTGMVCDLINENSIVTYHAILVMNMYIQPHTLTHKQQKTLRKKLMWYRQMKFLLPFRSKYEIFMMYFCVYDLAVMFTMYQLNEHFDNIRRIVDTSYRKRTKMQ